MADDEITIIRRIRHEISAECGHDIDRVVAYYRRVGEEIRRSGKFRFAPREVPPERSESPQRASGAETSE
jgi:hypothetical protein